MVQGPVPRPEKRGKMETVKKKLNELMILCQTDGFLIYSSGERLLSVPEKRESLAPLIQRYDDCKKSGYYVMEYGSYTVKPLRGQNAHLNMKHCSSQQDHKLLPIGWFGEEGDVKLKSEASEPQVDEGNLLAVLYSLTGDKDLDGLSIEELDELSHEIDSQMRATQAKLKPLDFLGNLPKRMKYDKEVKSGQNGKSGSVSFKPQLPFPPAEAAVKEVKIPKSGAVAFNDRDKVGYPLVQSSQDYFSFVLKGKDFESVEIRCRLANGAYEEHQNEGADSTTGNRDKNTQERPSHLKRKQRTEMAFVGSNNRFQKKNGEKDHVPYLTKDEDKLRLFLSGDQIESLELIGRLSAKAVSGQNQEMESEDKWLELTL